MQSLCVFCGSVAGKRPEYAAAASDLGRLLAAQNIALVWGGGKAGLMGAVADAALAAGGKAIGVIPAFMMERELAHPGATEMLVVESMHQRKAVMAERADAFVALPGGFGTLDEWFEILTWAKLHIHAKPIGLLNTADYFNPLLTLIDHIETEGFIKRLDRELMLVADTPESILVQLAAHASAAHKQRFARELT